MLIQVEPEKEPVHAEPRKNPLGQEVVKYIIPASMVLFVRIIIGVVAFAIVGFAGIFGFNFRDGIKVMDNQIKKVETHMKVIAGAANNVKKTDKEVQRLKIDMQKKREQVDNELKTIYTDVNLRITNALKKLPPGISEEKVNKIFEGRLASFFGKIKPNQTSVDIQEITKDIDAELLKKRETMQREISKDVDEAVRYLNQLFGLTVNTPTIKLENESEHSVHVNTDNQGKHYYHVPPQVKDLPDITYRNMAKLFIDRTVNFNKKGQAGALNTSYADILGTLVKLNRLNRKAEDTDWVIAPGYGAWLSRKDIDSTKPKVPMRSLKAPGEAYANHPILGNDPQPNHIRDLYTGTDEMGGIYINSGIPNKAFYEAASRIGSDNAIRIWHKALVELHQDSDFQDVAYQTYKASVKEYGENSKEANDVRKAWNLVGINVIFEFSLEQHCIMQLENRPFNGKVYVYVGDIRKPVIRPVRLHVVISNENLLLKYESINKDDFDNITKNLSKEDKYLFKVWKEGDFFTFKYYNNTYKLTVTRIQDVPLLEPGDAIGVKISLE